MHSVSLGYFLAIFVGFTLMQAWQIRRLRSQVWAMEKILDNNKSKDLSL